MLLSEYGSIDYVWQSEINLALEIIDKLVERKNFDKLFLRWIPLQSEIGFEEFRTMVNQKYENKQDTRTTEEILSHVKTILADVQKGD